MLQELELAFHDDLGDPQDRLPALIDVVDEELRPRNVFADVLPVVVVHRHRSCAAVLARSLHLHDQLPVDGVHTQREAPRLDDLDLVVTALRFGDDHVRTQADFAPPDARAVRPRGESLRWVRVEVVLYVIPRSLDLVARDAERLRNVAELVLTELAEVLGDDLAHVNGNVLADLLEVFHLDQHAFAYIARSDAPRLDGLDRAQRAHRVRHRHLHRHRRLLDGHTGIEVALLVDVADEVLGDREQPRWQEHAHVPRQPFGERLL